MLRRTFATLLQNRSLAVSIESASSPPRVHFSDEHGSCLSVPWLWITDHNETNFYPEECQRINDLPFSSSAAMQRAGLLALISHSDKGSLVFRQERTEGGPLDFSIPEEAINALFEQQLNSSPKPAETAKVSPQGRSRGYDPRRIRQLQATIADDEAMLRAALPKESFTTAAASSLDVAFATCDGPIAPPKPKTDEELLHTLPLTAEATTADERRAIAEAMLQYGCASIDCAALRQDPGPTLEETIAARERTVESMIESLFGVIRHTHYGGVSSWGTSKDTANKKGDGEQRLESEHLDTAYQNMGIALHTDSTYFVDPPRCQTFGCIYLTEKSSGGKNLVADGFAVATQLLRDEPEMFHLLATTPVLSMYEKQGLSFFAHRPTIRASLSRGRPNELLLKQITVNRYDRSPAMFSASIPDAGKLEAFYVAYQEFLRRCDASAIQLTPRIGRMLAFDNWRMLHARTGFSGPRLMCGAYVGSDDYASALRTAVAHQ